MTLHTLPPGFVLGDGSTAGAAARSGWRRFGWIITLVVVALLVLAFLVFTKAPTSTAPLSTNNAQPAGARALAEILRQQGVEVTESSTLSGASKALGADGTLVIAGYSILDTDQITSILAWPGPVIWLAPSDYDVPTIVPSTVPAADASSAIVSADCSVPAVQRAGDLNAPGGRYATMWKTPSVTTCYATPSTGDSMMLQVTRDGASPMTVIGAPKFLTNQYLADEGNASLALNLLGSTQHLDWYMGTPYDTSTLGINGQSGVVLRAPAWVNAAALAAALTFFMAGLWRGRRLGPLVTEPLPVVVPASEATTGRARLYRRGRASGHAAAALRAGSARRLAQRLGLGPHADRATITSAVAASSATDAATVDFLIFGPPPRDEASMLDLVRRLDALESEVDPT
ncbi:DUF4350 domain-containing protein [Demequina lutea]|uniref:DUF4350 domain-containing protein n=1 Tax=Demequina lutea TaxID=431489 RepID=A0A7Y9ZB04_9MICO|nr:DUF4350 domain-containing protein [Demequina lutea]NYI40795.1 hypothetical protein [Demequina lutea]